MNWFNIFNLYNLKKLKKDKWLILFTMISILVTCTVSVMVPMIASNLKNNNEADIKKINGGILSVYSYSQGFSKSFTDELISLRDKEYKVTFKARASSYFQSKAGTKIYASVIYGEEGLKDSETIISAVLAKNLSLKEGDKVKIISQQLGTKEYRIKAIEGNPIAVNNDEEIMGYAKISEKPDKASQAFIDGKGDGETLKKSLMEKEDAYQYCSLKDKKEEVKTQINTQIGTLGILTTMGYILSSITIVSTCIVLIIRRKKDIAIMKVLSIRNKDIKKAFRLEMISIIGVPIIVSLLLVFLLKPFLLSANYIRDSIGLKAELLIAFKGALLNGLFFVVFSSIPFILLNSIKGISLLRENEEDGKRVKIKIFGLVMLLIPIFMLLYSIYIGNTIILGSSLGVIVLILIFMALCSILIKIISSLPFKQNYIMYTFKNIKRNFLSFTIVALSLAITLSFILLAISLDKTIKNNLSKTLKEKLPYNYLLLKNKNEDVSNILIKKNGIDGYVRAYCSSGVIKNKDINSKEIGLYGIKQEDYKLSFKIVQGKTLDFKEKDQCLITSNYQKNNGLKIGDILNIETEGKEINLKVRGIYDNSFIDSPVIMIPYNGSGEGEVYFLNSKNTRWIKEIKNSPVVGLDSLGEGFSQIIEKFIKIFKMLSAMIIFSSLIFNINIVYITFSEDQKEQTIIRALGFNKSFLVKCYAINQMTLVLMSAGLAYGMYAVVSKLICLMINIKGVNSITEFLISILIGAAICFTTFLLPIFKVNKRVEYELLREN